jgi:hypothetical protein
MPAPADRLVSAVPPASVGRERPARRRATASRDGERVSPGLLHVVARVLANWSVYEKTYSKDSSRAGIP